MQKFKPLPDCKRKEYDECRALLILKECLGDRYLDLQLADKPDLQGDNIGVEVTTATDRNYEEGLSNWLKAQECEDENQKQIYIERMRQLGYNYSEYAQTWNGYAPKLEMIINAIKSKTNKIQKGGYKCFPINELFIFTDVWMKDEVLLELEKDLREKNVFSIFECIHILEKGYLLFRINNSGYEKMEIDISEQSNRNIRARQIVENKCEEHK